MVFENWTLEEWNETLIEKYQNLYKIVDESIPELWLALEFALSIKTIMNIKNCSLPFSGIILGAPSSLKTVIVELFKYWKNSYYTDNFSAKSLVSHYAGVEEKKLKEIDMLPKIKDKLFLCSDYRQCSQRRKMNLTKLLE